MVAGAATDPAAVAGRLVSGVWGNPLSGFVVVVTAEVVDPHATRSSIAATPPTKAALRIYDLSLGVLHGRLAARRRVQETGPAQGT